MRQAEGTLRLSASDEANFLACRHLTAPGSCARARGRGEFEQARELLSEAARDLRRLAPRSAKPDELKRDLSSPRR